jgi:hypothetical protein
MAKKAGEKAKNFVVHSLFVVIVVFCLYFVATHSPTITGHAVLDANTSKAKLESALASASLFGLITQTSMCIVINDATQPLSFQAVKTATGWTVYEMKDFCTGASNEEVIVQFPDYDSFSKIVDNPSPRAIANGAINQDFEILPSKYVELGGNVECDSMFKAKYCSALKTMGSTSQLIDGDLTCCIDEWTRADKKLLEQHLAEGNFDDEQKVLEQPTKIAGLSMGFVAGIGGAIFVIIIAVLIFVFKGHGPAKPAKGAGKAGAGAKAGPGVKPGMPGAAPGAGVSAGVAVPGAPMMAGAARPAMEKPEITELRNYVVQAMGEGYPYDEIRAHLLEIGWDDSVADKVIREAYEKLQGQQN